MTSKNLPWHGLTAQLFLKFLLITQHEVPFTNTSEATKRSSKRTENGKCTDVTNRRSRLGLSTPIYTNHRYNHKIWWVFSLSHIFTDLIMNNYRSNQSALMTRCGTDFRHQYGIFGGESQTSFTQNATQARSQEGQLFSQATEHPAIIFAHQVNAKVISSIFCWVSTRCACLKYMTWQHVPNE